MPWVIFVTIGAFAAYTLSHMSKSGVPRKVTRVALGDGYTVELTPEPGRFVWVLENEFLTAALAAGEAPTYEQAQIKARIAMAADIAKRNALS